jgi:hypothetical protein
LKWCITYQKFEYTGDKRSGAGSTFYLEEKAGGPLMKLNFTVTEWVENQRLACKMTSGNFLKGYEQKGIMVSANEAVALRTIQLEIGATSETVEVTAAAARVETQSSERTGLISSTQVSELASSPNRASLVCLR